MSRLKSLYKDEIVDAMIKKFGYKNVMEVPKLDKIVVNVGAGEAKDGVEAITDTGNGGLIMPTYVLLELEAGSEPLYEEETLEIINAYLNPYTTEITPEAAHIFHVSG